jgi:hypothetical protein
MKEDSNNMRTATFSTDVLRSFFQEHIIGTMDQLKHALGTSVDMTIYRKLRQLSSLTSYSHQGKYHTLQELAEFDSLGLWQFDVARFSKYGTLLRTARALIEESDKGYSLAELRSRVGVDLKETLLQLQNQYQVYREKIAGRYVYFSIDPKRRSQQHLQRLEEKPHLRAIEGDILAHEVRAAIILFFSLLDERQRRLYAGLESIRIGRGGDSTISSLLQIDHHTVARGRRELIQRDIEIDHIRKKGGGRLPIKKNSTDH